ncbi:MAG TPA: TonB-dependent receptor, partial [Bryobacteraceae bacterium]|nr:TonB-dependent receptor [Bryobacteraceae bacterium]
FARFNQAPSVQEGAIGLVANPTNIQHYSIGTDMLTLGLTHTITPRVVNELRLNVSQQDADVSARIRAVDGAQIPPQSALFPPGFSPADSSVLFDIVNCNCGAYYGKVGQNRARQFNLVDNFSYIRGQHQFKFGIDYRLFGPSLIGNRLNTEIAFPSIYGSDGLYGGVGDFVVSSFNGVFNAQNGQASYLVNSFSAYAQDTWRIHHRLTATYGVRWEVDPAPSLASGQANLAVLHSLNNLASVMPAPPGTPLYPTGYRNFAPRLGAAWQIANGSRGVTVLRAGAGLFYDLGQAGFGDSSYQSPVIGEVVGQPLGSLPTSPSIGNQSAFSPVPPIAAAPGYRLPRVYQWNVTIEQSFGPQTFSAGYVGAAGRRLTGFAEVPSNNFPYLEIFGNNASSSYNALQVHYDRRLSRRVQALVSYTWAHSIDDESEDLPPFALDDLMGPDLYSFLHAQINKGSSDFDIRHALNGALLAALPSPAHGAVRKSLRDWTASTIFFAHSALPMNLVTGDLLATDGPGWVRPNIIPGEPSFVYSSGYPGGKAINFQGFAVPPLTAEEGNLGRNVLRGFGAWQIDFALYRTFRLTEHTSLQFRAEAFNVLNHPNFANPSNPDDPNDLSILVRNQNQSTNSLANGLAPGVPGQLNSLFQIGSPRSMQLALRLRF